MDVTAFASRTADCKHLEDIYTVIDEYSIDQKGYRNRSYAVTMLATDTTRGYRVICRDGDVIVREVDEHGAEQPVNDEEHKSALIMDFFQRTMIAVVRESSRDAVVRAQADKDARGKLIQLSYPDQYIPDDTFTPEQREWLTYYEDREDPEVSQRRNSARRILTQNPHVMTAMRNIIDNVAQDTASRVRYNEELILPGFADDRL